MRAGRMAIGLGCAALSTASLVPGQVAAEDANGPAAIAVAVIKANRECFSSVVRATGYVIPRTTAVVMFNVPGFRFEAVSAKEGDWIKAGDPVAVAVPSNMQTPAPAVPAQAPAVPSRIVIKSLASGIVLSRKVEVGMPASASNGPLFTIAVDGEMEALIDVPSVHVPELSAGQVVHLSMDDGQDLSGRVRLVPVEISKGTQVGQARLSIDGDQSLRMGRFVRVAIDARRSCGIGVPLAALTHESDGTRLQIVKNGTIETRLVVLGLSNETDAEIKSGIVDGELVVSDAGTSLRDGDKVRPIVADFQESR